MVSDWYSTGIITCYKGNISLFDESNSGGSFLFRFMLLCQIQCAMRILHITVEKIMKIIEIIKSSISFKWQRNLRPAELWITPPFGAVALW